MAACTRASSTPAWPRRSRHAGVDFVELFPSGADESSPIVVVIHGSGDRPDRVMEAWRTFPTRAWIALPKAFAPQGAGLVTHEGRAPGGRAGFSWFDYRDGMTDEEFGAEVGASEAKLWRGIADLAGAKRVIVCGFSQGALLAFAIASRHADAVTKAFAVSGSCPGPLLPKNGAKAAPLVAFHGTNDPVIQFKYAKAAVDAFAREGNDARLREYAGVGHEVTPAMRADLIAELQAALGQGARP